MDQDGKGRKRQQQRDRDPVPLEDGGVDGGMPPGSPGHEIGEDYEKLRQKIFAWVSNKVAARGGPVPMEIGKVDKWTEEEETDIEVDAVGNAVQCHKCLGWGHAARNCPSGKAGKGVKGHLWGGRAGGGAEAGGKGGKGDYGGKAFGGPNGGKDGGPAKGAGKG